MFINVFDNNDDSSCRPSVVYTQITNDNTLKHSCNNTEYVFIGEGIIVKVLYIINNIQVLI